MTRHKLDLFSLFSGLILVVIAIVALFGVGLGVAAWVWPAALITLGVVVLASVVASSRAPDEPAPATPVDPDRAAAMAAARDEVEDVDVTTD